MKAWNYDICLTPLIGHGELSAKLTSMGHSEYAAGGIDPMRFGEVANRYADWMQQYYDALAESDTPILFISAMMQKIYTL